MFDCKCFCWNRAYDVVSPEPEPFSLPSPIPQWPEGKGFAQGRICIGEIEVVQITKFEHVWSCHLLKEKTEGASFYKPSGIPDGFFSLGHYVQPNDQPLQGFVIVARDIGASKTETKNLPALQKPLDYTLIWSTDDWAEDNHDGCGYFWLPCPPEGYKAMGCVVTNKPDAPSIEEVRCVRADLTDTCETYDLIITSSKFSFWVWNTRPCHRGMWCKGLSLGTFFCSSDRSSGDELSISCLKNLDSSLHAMPNLDQIHALIKNYGPTVFFHPDEAYLPSSVPWFFKNGALLYKRGKLTGEAIDSSGSNLPGGGKNDGEYWIDLPNDDQENYVKQGNIDSAELYVHVKPALGGTFTDIAMWVFCPFNGPATLKVGFLNLKFSKIGQHVGDWEHFTLRVSNFSGELWSVYFSQHSGGEWVNACDLEYIEGNKAIVYSSKSGHASFPHPGDYLQGSQKLGIGIRNDAARSDLSVDSSIKYQIIAAEYLGEGKITEPSWLQYMREWGPTIVYSSRSEVEKLISVLPFLVRYSIERIFNKFPIELSGEEGPTGPKEKNNWEGDERC
ncbi:hypothetical protein At1g04090-like [Magnolia sinica]|uniref:hypothetical protein At1g04090-like n=1 Tax=Magnolia sinica TaxID=86752 RepID=UPI002658F829|nr:hypothetical protein At1g04090-like [Magnolia sinica]